MAETSQDYGTIIGADARIKGELSFDSAAKVMGQLEGSISGKGRVHIASGSKCKATVRAKEVAVEGLVEGNVEASDHVELKPKGRITGDVVAARMSMGDGASFVGHCRIGKDAQEGARAASTTEVKAQSQAQPAAAVRK
jgi:cytoskeletal protein CcmA (bactofilin family)